jgi:hypothetical protein
LIAEETSIVYTVSATFNGVHVKAHTSIRVPTRNKKPVMANTVHPHTVKPEPVCVTLRIYSGRYNFYSVFRKPTYSDIADCGGAKHHDPAAILARSAANILLTILNKPAIRSRRYGNC